MRKWLVVLLAIVLLHALPRIGPRGGRSDSTLLKRIGETVDILVWVLLAVYLGAFLYWLFIVR